MNRKEFQQWLEQFPEDTIIEVVVQESDNWSDRAVFADFIADPSEFEYLDFTNNPYSKGKPYDKKKYLRLGSCL